MKIFVILVYLNLVFFCINKVWVEWVKKEENVYVYDLYVNYFDFKIDVEKE